jgi:hypothetical protein
MSMDEKTSNILRLQEEYNLEEVAVKVGYKGTNPKKTLGKYMNKRGYIILDGKYVLKSGEVLHTNSVKTIYKDTMYSKDITPLQVEFMKEDTLKSLLELVKNKDDLLSLIREKVTVVNTLVIDKEYPGATNKSYRPTEENKKRFEKICKEYAQYSATQIFNYMIEEFYNSYKIK